MLAIGSSAQRAGYAGAEQRVGRGQGARRRVPPRSRSAQPPLGRVDRRASGGRRDDRGRRRYAAPFFQTQPAQSVTRQARPPSIATEAAWLYKDGWPLYALVDVTRRRTARRADQLPRDRGLFRSARRKPRGPARRRPRGHEPRRLGPISADWCASSSSRRNSRSSATASFRRSTPNCDAWRKAEGIARLAAANVVPSVDRRLVVPRRIMSRRRGAAGSASPEDRRAHLLPRLTRLTLRG